MQTLVANARSVCGRYTLLEKLGMGGQGEVWRARDEREGCELALKVLSPTLSRNEGAWVALKREHEIVGRLDHPGILKVYEPERDDQSIVLPMELASGGDLRRLRGASYLEMVPVLIELARALEHAHARGVVHRDLKPGNVLFDADEHVRLADFGVAGTPLSTPRGLSTALSPFTASPAQLLGEPPTVADDVYGLGALIYELLTGYPPYYPRFNLQRVLEEPVPELKPRHQAPPRLMHLVIAMLAKKPRDRPPSMREVIGTLEATLNDTLACDFDAPTENIERPEEAAHAATIRSAVPETTHADAPEEPAEPVDTVVPAPAPAPMGLRPAAPAPLRTFSGRPLPPRTAQAESPAVERSPAPTPLIPGHATADELAAARAQRPQWADLKVDPVHAFMRIEPEHRRRWPWVMLVLLAVGAAASFYWLPRLAPDLLTQNPSPTPAATAATPAPAAVTPAPVPASEPVAAPSPQQPPTKSADDERVGAARASFDKSLSALDARGAGVWGGVDYASAKARAAEAVGAYDAGNTQIALARLTEAQRLLDAVGKRAPQALSVQLAAGEQALTDGDPARARQAFEFAHRIAPDDRRPADGLHRAGALESVLPLLADAVNAEAAHDYARAAQDFSQALTIDPGNARARAGLARANTAFGSDNYAKAVGAGFAALAAGRLEDARSSFEQAGRARPGGREAVEGLERVGAAMRARDYGGVRTRAAALEAQERWNDALEVYEQALKADPMLTFAVEGKARAAARADLARDLQAFIDRPQRLTDPIARSEAQSLLEQARAQEPAGPVLRSQAARLAALLPTLQMPTLQRPVHLALESDNATQVAIPEIGSFGTFSRRDIQLKPGRYTVIGTRAGYRDVRREFTITAGEDVQTISVRCVEPI
jgi:eukaryotic-like serine/threonine-protein kinase